MKLGLHFQICIIVWRELLPIVLENSILVGCSEMIVSFGVICHAAVMLTLCCSFTG